jgi:SAM-dependent methyltransferase
MQETLRLITSRYAAYLDAPIINTIGSCDDMFAGEIDHYFNVGHSAVAIIIEAMIAARVTQVRSILDLPCGGGRVTRHLKALFPDADLYAADINTEKQSFVVATFGATALNTTPDFREPPPRQFDLVFVGSLLTHLNSGDFVRALHWAIAATAPDGLIIASLHGRKNVANVVKRLTHLAVGLTDYHRTGFGFTLTHRESKGGISVEYGRTWTKPSWVMQQVQDHPDVRIVGFHEAIWDKHHDVIALQKRPIA